MKLNIGKYIDETTGEAYDRYLLMGRVVKDAEFKTVGAKGTSMLTFPISTGRGEDLLRIKMWGYDALDFNGTKKGTTMLIDAYEQSREYMGKTYVDYVPINAIDMTEKKSRGQARTRTPKEVVPENPMDMFTDIQNPEDLPF